MKKLEEELLSDAYKYLDGNLDEKLPSVSLFLLKTLIERAKTTGDKNNISTAYLNRGKAYQNYLGETNFAVRDFNNAIRLNSENQQLNFELYKERGRAYLKLHQPGLAISDFNKSIDLIMATLEKEEMSNLYELRGRTYLELEQYTLALEDSDRAIELNSANALAYNTRGIVNIKLNQVELAIVDFNKSIEFNPSNPAPYKHLAEIYHELNNKNKARSMLEPSLKIDSEY